MAWKAFVGGVQPKRWSRISSPDFGSDGSTEVNAFAGILRLRLRFDAEVDGWTAARRVRLQDPAAAAYPSTHAVTGAWSDSLAPRSISTRLQATPGVAQR